MRRRRTHFGEFGKPVELLEAFIDWKDELELTEADSKADFATFLYGPISTSMYQGYSYVQPQYRRYARVESPKDFRDHRVRGLNELVGFGYVGDHGDYAEMSRTERPSARIAVDTYGAVYRITRQLIRNDDTQELLNRVPTEMGRQAGRFVAETLISLIQSNPLAPDGVAMFHATRGNTLTLALSEDSLVTAIAAMEDQLDDNGRQIHITPRYLVVKSARLQLQAQRIIRSQQSGTTVNYTGAAGAGSDVFDKGNWNPLADILPADGVIRDPFWSDNNDWYLFADPNEVPGFAVAFLDGKEEPFIGLKDPQVRSALGPGTDPYEFDIDEISFKVRLDYGCAPIDPRGVLRSVVA